MEISLQKKLMDEIFVVTAKIQQEFPELYKLLSETPLFIAFNEKVIDNNDFEHYLESLKTQLMVYEKAAHIVKISQL